MNAAIIFHGVHLKKMVLCAQSAMVNEDHTASNGTGYYVVS